MDKNIIIVILIVIIVAIIGVFLFNSLGDTKLNTEINFLSDSNLKNGDKIEFELKDTKGNTLSEQNVTIIYQSNGNDESYSVITDNNGKAYLELTNEPTGEHKVTVKYDGTDKYNACIGEQTITIGEGTSESSPSSAINSTASTAKYHTNSTAKTGTSNSTVHKTKSTSSSKTSSKNNTRTEDPRHQYAANLYYDSILDVYYDDFGTIHGGKYDGQEIADLWSKNKKTK